ncbi:MAG: HAMP domain-containing sensor histidine kinase [Acidimicrobiia bacterium]
MRTRLLTAMAAIAVGVLVVTGVTTVALARRGAERTAINHLEDQAPQVAQQLRALARAIRGRDFNGRPTAPISRLLTSVLRVTNGTVVTVGADGSMTAGAGALVGSDGTGTSGQGTSTADSTPTTAGPLRSRLRARLRRRASTTTTSGRRAATVIPAGDLPAGLSFADLDAATLLDGDRQSGYVGGRAFVAEPIIATAGGNAVLVLREAVDSGAVSRARGFFLIGGALALAVAFVVSFLLARRLTRPLAAMGVTANAIAGGDLAARVDLGQRTDVELADLARTLNGMAGQLEEARHAERAFLLSVSHDLRTPLTSIRGFAEALTDGTIPATEEQRRAGAVIAAEANRLERLVADLLDLARLDAHQFSLALGPFDLAETVRTAVAAFDPPAAALGIALEVAVPNRLEATGDPERVAQIVANLVENALKYARAVIAVEASAPDDATVVLEVRDDGPGIDPQERHRVFERLYVSRTTPGRSVGTGLGLAIVGELAHAMGGDASADTSSASGATFRVRLPLGGPSPQGVAS